nr:MAG TPA: hypothetical protein [Caudoviricetes sp.]
MQTALYRKNFFEIKLYLGIVRLYLSILYYYNTTFYPLQYKEA